MCTPCTIVEKFDLCHDRAICGPVSSSYDKFCITPNWRIIFWYFGFKRRLQNLFDFCFWREAAHAAHKFSLLRFYNEWNVKIKFQWRFSLRVWTAIWMSHTHAQCRYWRSLQKLSVDTAANQLILRNSQFINVFRRHIQAGTVQSI